MADPTDRSSSSPAAAAAPHDQTGVTIIGARQAGESLLGSVQPVTQWAEDADAADPTAGPGQLKLGEALDSAESGSAESPADAAAADDSDEYSGMDAAWMDAGDTTLGNLLGAVPPTKVPMPGRASGDADAADDAGDDVFPESMYPADTASDFDTGVIVAAAAATLERRDRRMADRRAELHVDDAPAPQAVKRVDPEDADRWGAFAGAGPRWRDDAKDWADVDAADTSVLGDVDTQIGTLGSSRSERSDLYSIDDSVPTRRSVGERLGAATERGAGAKQGSTAVNDPVQDAPRDQAKVIRFDSLAKDADHAIPVSSGGPAQRGDRRRAAAAAAAAAGAGAAESRTAADAEKAQGAGRATTGPGRSPAARSAGGGRPAAPTVPSTVTARLGTGVLLILAVGLVFTFTGTIGAALLAAVAIAMTSIELMHALKDRGFRPAIPAVAVGLMGVVGGGMWRGERGVMVAIVVTIAAIASWYLFGAERERPAANLAASFLSFGYPAIGAATAALLLNAPHGLGLLMPAIVCTVAHDVFAYAGGRLVGRTHFTDISPNKTVEGLVIGILGSVAVSALLFGRLGWHPWTGYPQAIALGLVIGVAAPIGDLFESLLKRDLNIKDMGRLLPGHGGVFDRIDAMLLAVPATWLVALATNHL